MNTDLTRQQLCAQLQVSDSTIRGMVKLGMPVIGEGRERRYDLEAIKAWCKERQKPPPPIIRPNALAAFEGKTMRNTQFIKHRLVRVPGQPLTKGRHFGKSQEAVMPLLLEHIPGTRTKRWREAVLSEMMGLPEIVHAEDDFRTLIRRMVLVPDAYLINMDVPELHFFEVEVSSPMSRDKLQTYAKFLTDLHFYGIEFACFTVNQHGHINEVHLFPHYLDWLEAQGEIEA